MSAEHRGPLSQEAVATAYDRLAQVIEPRSDLDYRSDYELLVAVVLSAQATDQSVNRATATLFREANTPQAMVDLGPDGVLPHIRHVGLAPTKAKNVVALSRLLLERHDGAVPSTRAELEALPGVGRKTANVVLNIAFGEPTIAVDTHVHRLANRLGIAATTKVADTEAVLRARTPERHARHAHHYLILHGRYTCTARKPKCGSCVLADLCPSRAA